MRKAIILAGGKGTRLYPVTLETPKPLLTVNRKPIINYLIELFADHGVQEIKVVIRPQDREEFGWWQSRWQKNFKNISVSFEEETEPMGTLGYWAYQLADWTGNEPFFLTNGDELKQVDLSAMKKHHQQNKGLVTIALVQVPNPSEYGVAILNNHQITEFLEKPVNPCLPAGRRQTLISSGLYIVDPAAASYLSSKVKNGDKFLMIEKDLFPHLAKDGKLVAYKSNGRWFDCGNLERWEKAIKEWGA